MVSTNEQIPAVYFRAHFSGYETVECWKYRAASSHPRQMSSPLRDRMSAVSIDDPCEDTTYEHFDEENEAPSHVIYQSSAPRSHVQVINSLQNNIMILDAELMQIEQDLLIQQRMIKKYGAAEGHEKGEKRLLFLKHQKENSRVQLFNQLERVEKAIRGSHKLARDLEESQMKEELRNARRQQERQKRLGAVGVQLGRLRSDPTARLFEVSQNEEGSPTRTSLSQMDLSTSDPTSLEDRLKAASPILSHRAKKKIR